MSKRKREDPMRLAAPCGLYCGACSIRDAVNRNDKTLLELMTLGIEKYLRHPVDVTDLSCDGCLSAVRAAPCRECAIRDCAVSRGISRCAACNEFPCQLIEDFNNDGLAHHSEVLDNVRRQREIGIDAWLEEQAKRWACQNCGTAVDWYSRNCRRCGATLQGHF